MNLPPEIQRLLPYIAVAVLAVVGLLLVVRGVGPSGSETGPSPAPIERRTDPAPRGGSGAERGEERTRKRAPARRSAEAYVDCVRAAPNTAALEKCQALLP